MDLTRLEDIAGAREHLRKVLEMLPFSPTTSMRRVLCLSEAATNP